MTNKSDGFGGLLFPNLPKQFKETIPVVRHKAVAEVSKIGNYRRGELL